jgi:integrase
LLQELGFELWIGDPAEIRTKLPKTKKSKALIPVIKPLRDRLELLHLRQGNPTAGPMWPNKAAKPQPMCLNNLLERVILRTLNRCVTCHKSEAEHAKHPVKFADHKYVKDSSIGVAWHGWHAFRRGLASNLYALGVPDKVIQAILRHANVTTTMTHYVKTSGEAEKAAMGQLEAALVARNLARKQPEAAVPVLQ